MTTTTADTSGEAWASGDRRRHDASARALLAELFAEHGRLVLGVCRSLMRDAHEAEDAAQQTFLSAYKAVLRGDAPRQPAAWLATIARNECRSRLRDRMREPLPDECLDIAAPDDVTDTIRSAALWEAVAGLPLQQRRALVLRELGLSYEELATELSVSAPAVESLLFRARTRLRGSLVANGAYSVAGLRELVARLLPTSGPVSQLASNVGGPLTAKVVAATATVALLAGGSLAVRHAGHRTPHHVAATVRPRAALPAARPPARASTPAPALAVARASSPPRVQIAAAPVKAAPHHVAPVLRGPRLQHAPAAVRPEARLHPRAVVRPAARVIVTPLPDAAPAATATPDPAAATPPPAATVVAPAPAVAPAAPAPTQADPVVVTPAADPNRVPATHDQPATDPAAPPSSDPAADPASPDSAHPHDPAPPADPSAPDPTTPDPTTPDPTAPDPTAPQPTAPDPTTPDPSSTAPAAPGPAPAG